MAGSINEATLLGHLGADPEMRRTGDGRSVANFTVATTESWRDSSSGERKEKTEWHSVVVFAEGLCRVAEQYLKKGSKVLVRGKLQTRKWQDQSGSDRYKTEIVLQGFDAKLVLLDGRDGGGGARDDGGRREQRRSGDGKRQANSAPSAGGNSRFQEDMSDDIPF